MLPPSADAEDINVTTTLGVDGLPADTMNILAKTLKSDIGVEAALECFEKFVIQATLARHKTQQEAADVLGMARGTLAVKRKKYGLE